MRACLRYRPSPVLTSATVVDGDIFTADTVISVRCGAPHRSYTTCTLSTLFHSVSFGRSSQYDFNVLQHGTSHAVP